MRCVTTRMFTILQMQKAVTADLKSKQLLLLAFKMLYNSDDKDNEIIVL